MFHQNESSIQNRRTLITLNKIIHIKNNNTLQPFPTRQHSLKICKPFQFTPYHLAGSTWDAKHLDSFIQPKMAQSRQQRRSQTNKSSRKQKAKFENEQKNVSQYGYTNVFPLIQKPQKLKTIENVGVHDQLNFKSLIPNEIKENLMTPKQRLEQLKRTKQAIEKLKLQKSLKSQKNRLQQLLKKVYPHGINGYENPESQQKMFSNNLELQKSNNKQIVDKVASIYRRYIKSPVFDKSIHDDKFPKQTFELSPIYKKKHRQSSYYKPRQEKSQINRLSKASRRQFNIINNISIC